MTSEFQPLQSFHSRQKWRHLVIPNLQLMSAELQGGNVRQHFVCESVKISNSPLSHRCLAPSTGENFSFSFG